MRLEWMISRELDSYKRRVEEAEKRTCADSLATDETKRHYRELLPKYRLKVRELEKELGAALPASAAG